MRRQGRRAGAITVIVLSAATAVAAVVLLPSPIVDFTTPGLDAPSRSEALIALRLHILYMLGGVIAVVSLVYSHLRHTREREQLAIDRSRATNERFQSAAFQLAEGAQITRLAGIFALRRIARDSAPDLKQISQLLTAFSNSAGSLRVPLEDRAKVADDVVAAVHGVIELWGPRKNEALVLEGLNLREAVINVAAPGTTVMFFGCDLSFARISGDIEGLSFSDCDLTKAQVTAGDRAVSLMYCNANSANFLFYGELEAFTSVMDNSVIQRARGGVVYECSVTNLRSRLFEEKEANWPPKGPKVKLAPIDLKFNFWDDGPPTSSHGDPLNEITLTRAEIRNSERERVESRVEQVRTRWTFEPDKPRYRTRNEWL